MQGADYSLRKNEEERKISISNRLNPGWTKGAMREEKKRKTMKRLFAYSAFAVSFSPKFERTCENPSSILHFFFVGEHTLTPEEILITSVRFMFFVNNFSFSLSLSFSVCIWRVLWYFQHFYDRSAVIFI